MAKNTSDPKIWYQIINKLNQTKLKYVLVGGAALIIHGLPRSTLDIDIYIPAKKEALDKLFKISDSLELATKQKSILKISDSPELFVDQWLCFSYKGQDILDVYLSGEKEFKKLYTNSIQKKDKTISVRVASLKDIEAMKKESGRPIDLADIEFIKEAKKYKKSA